MGIIQRKHAISINGDQQKPEIDQFCSVVNQSIEWIKKYDKLDDLQKTDLHNGILQKIKESVQKNDLNGFIDLCKKRNQLNDTEKNKKLMKIKNLFILACKYNRLEILKYLLNDTIKISYKFATIIDQHNFICNNIYEVDKAGHSACYYAIRSNNVDLLETLIEPIDQEPKIMYDILSNDYASLKLKNVYIHEIMQIFVEDRLLRGRFLRDIANANDGPMLKSKKKRDYYSRPEVQIYKRLNFIIIAVKEFNKIALRPDVQNQKITMVLVIARNIRVLKSQLKSTYIQIPWEEIEFYASRYAHLHPVEGKQLHDHLKKFIDKLKTVFGIQDDNKNESDVYEEIKKYMNGTVPIIRQKIEDFKDLYDDYELMKDEYSLDKMIRYIQLALSANPKEQSGRLVIQRALHVIGEFVKNSPASPNLSQTAQEHFYSNEMGVCIEVAPSLRDALSHIEELHVLFLRGSIESQEDFFAKLQQDLKRAIGVVVHVSCCVKAKHFRKWCRNIMDENDSQVFEQQCEGFIDYLRRNELPDVEAPELDALNEAEYFLTLLQMIIYENGLELNDCNVLVLITEVGRIIELEKRTMADRIKNFNTTFRNMKEKITGHLYQISQLDKRGNDTSNKIVKESSKMFFKYVFYNIQVPLNSGGLKRMSEIGKLLDQIIDCVNLTPKYREIFKLVVEIRTLLRTKSYSLIFKTLEEYQEKLDLPETDQSTSAENIEIELDEVLRKIKSELGSEEIFRDIQSMLKKKKLIHQIKLRVNGCYEDNKDQFTVDEIRLINEEMRAKRSEGKRLLEKTVDFYGEFLAGKREFHKFAGAIRLESKMDTARLIEMFNSIKSQRIGYDPKSMLNETIRQFHDESTMQRYDDLVKKFEIIEQDHKARLKLTSFFDCVTELDKKTYDKLIGSLNTTPKTRTDLDKIYKYSNIAYVAESLSDAYGTLLNIIGSKKSATEKICNAYINFIDALQLDSNTTKLLRRSIIKNRILKILDEQFLLKLNLLKEVVGNVRSWDSKFAFISRYKEDEKLQAVVEILLFDLSNVSTEIATIFTKFMPTTYPVKFLERGFLYLEGNLPFLKENSLRNYLAHGDALIDALPFDPSIAVISSAILFSEEGESLMALGDLINNDNMYKNLINEMKKSPEQLLPENFPSDAQFDFDSLRKFQKSNYWKHYLKPMPQNNVEEIDLCSLYDRYLNQCIGQVSLFTAVNKGDKQIFEILLASGEEVCSREFNEQSLLHIAAHKGHNKIVEILLDARIIIDAKDREKKTSMIVAARSGNNLVVETLISRGADVHAADMSGRTALHEAAIMGHFEVAAILLKNGADCNACSYTDSTPLHNAAWRGNLKMIKLLIEDYKANMGIEDHLGNKPLHMAAKGLHNNAEVFDYLLTKDPASVNSKNNSGTTPLLVAIVCSNDNGVEIILEKGGIESHHELLLTAVLYGNVKIVRLLREDGVDVNDVNWSGCSSAVHIAARNGRSKLVEYLIQEKYPVETKTDIGITPLHLAAQSGDLDTVKVLLDVGKCDSNTRDQDGTTPLHVAVFYNHLSIVEYLVRMKADPNALDYSGKSLLHGWASNGNSDVKIPDYLINDLHLISMLSVRDQVGRTPLGYAAHIATMSAIKYFVEKGAELDVRDVNGATLLHLAADRGDLHLVKYFIGQMGKDIDKIIYAAADGGDNVLHVAVKLGHTNIVNALLETRKDKRFIDSYNDHQFTPLFYAVKKGHTNIVEVLLKNDACSNGWDNLDYSPLQLAATFGFKNIVKILLNHGAEPNRLTNERFSPLFCAVIQDQEEIVTMLLDAGANINCTSYDGMTALHAAAKLNHYSVAELLVRRGADVRAIDKDGVTPLDYAIENCDLKMNFILTMTIPDYLIRQLK